ncbi:MAG: ArsB/NhaD family transporter [Paenibacillaceae bacterium]
MDHLVQSVPHWQVITAIIIFLLTYAFIITEKINRAVVALMGALLMVIVGIVDVHSAYSEHIEWETIFLLIGMMILVGIANRTGMFQYVAVKAAQFAKGNPVKLLIYLPAITAIGSAFLDNVTTVLLIVPVTFSVTRILRVNPLPYLISEILASNIGGTATLIGDPPNIMIGTANKHLTFNDFIINLSPVVIVIMIVTTFVLVKYYRKLLVVDEEQVKELMKLNAASYITDKLLMMKSITILILTVIGFTLHSVIHVEAAVIAVAGATILMLIGVKEQEMEEVFHSIEWVTIFFFAGLFVLVGGLVDAGIISNLASRMLEITEDNFTFMSMLVLWGSGLASATIDNIPFVATMIPLIQDMGTQLGAEPEQLNSVWWALSLGACLGGNGTLIGASANVVVAGMAFREGHKITYLDFLKIGALVTFISLVICTVYMLVFIV